MTENATGLPPIKKGDRYGYGSYQDLIGTFDAELLLYVEQKDFQGDSWALLGRGLERGFLTFGWGSCSGCDALEACDSDEDATELRDSLYRSIHWEADSAKLRAYLSTKDFATEWYGRQDEFRDEFLPKALEMLA